VVKAWQGGDERQKIRERTMRGRITKARAGRVVGQGTAPYGYHYANDTFVIDELEVRTIRMIFDWYVNTGLSCQRIADRLTELAIPRPENQRTGNGSAAKVAHRRGLQFKELSGLKPIRVFGAMEPNKSRSKCRYRFSGNMGTGTGQAYL
jgi:hypothetical protein